MDDAPFRRSCSIDNKSSQLFEDRWLENERPFLWSPRFTDLKHPHFSFIG